MKKIIGWVLVVCGVFSLPRFLSNLSKAHDGYEVIGMLIGQGLIYFLAYLCLRNKVKKNNPNDPIHTQNESFKIAHPQQTNNSKIDKEINELVCKSLKQEDVIITNEILINEKVNAVIKPVADYSAINSTANTFKQSKLDAPLQKNELISKDYTDQKIDGITWSSIYSHIFNYQKEELLKKCNPSNFMAPYNHDKIAIANDIIRQISLSSYLSDLKAIRIKAYKLGVSVDTSHIYEYLSKICNPTNFIGNFEEFETANDLYQRLVTSNLDYEILEEILDDAHRAKLGIIEEVAPIVKEPLSKSTIVFLLCCGIWEVINLSLWGLNGSLYNATQYFFPFQTTNIAKFDYTEFLVYGVAVPIASFCVFKMLKKIK